MGKTQNFGFVVGLVLLSPF